MARRPGAGADPRETILRTARVRHARLAAARVRLWLAGRVNKALIYYYFGSNRCAGRAQGVAEFAACMRAVVEARVPPEKLSAWTTGSRPTRVTVLPRIMLRELADGGVHRQRDPPRSHGILPSCAHRAPVPPRARSPRSIRALHFVLLGSTDDLHDQHDPPAHPGQLGFAQPPLEIAPFVRHLQEFALRSCARIPNCSFAPLTARPARSSPVCRSGPSSLVDELP
jgi:hypothetical protein